MCNCLSLMVYFTLIKCIFNSVYEDCMAIVFNKITYYNKSDNI